MKTMVRDFARVILVVVTVVVGCGVAQQSAPEKHVKDIRAEQTQDAILASALCQKVRAYGGHLFTHFPKVNPATLEADLSALMQKSDEVVLASPIIIYTSVLSPSGEDAITYYDVKVLRAWKGSHKRGDMLTFALPMGAVECQSKQQPGNIFSLVGNPDWHGEYFAGPYVLFLRQSKGDEIKLMPGLRLTGGKGLQGLFIVRHDPNYDRYCANMAPDAEKCNSAFDTSPFHVSVRYRLDPLQKKYDGMPVPSFLKEVQSVAESLGYTGQAPSAK